MTAPGRSRSARLIWQVSLKLIAEQLLLGSPETGLTDNLSHIKLYIPGELTASSWIFRTAVTVYASPNNPGAEAAVIALRDGLGKVNHANVRPTP